MVKKLEDYEWICPEPFTNLKTSPIGQMMPCCVTTYEHYGSDIKNMDMSYVQNTSLKDYHKSDFIKLIKKALKENNKDILKQTCYTCIKQEECGQRSHRQYYLSKFRRGDFKIYKKKLEKIIDTEEYPDFLHTVELNCLTGNLCNNACHTCLKEYSSKYFAEQIKLKEIPKQTAIIKPEHNKEFLDEIAKTKILEFKFTGGEPLLGDTNYDVMRKLDKSTIIRIITNGTQDPTTLINILKDFKKVTINVSAEGVKDVSDYLRYPSDFNIVLKHYDMMQKVWGKEVMFTTTINALNIARITELLKLRKGHAGSLVVNNEYSLNSIPDDIKEIYLNKLYEDGATNLIGYLENAVYNETDMWKMLMHIKRRDRLRKTNLLDVFPEWKKYYENCNG